MKRKNGFVLIFALVITILVVLIISTFFLIASNNLLMSNTASNTMRAYYIAEAGLAKKFMDLRGGSASATSGTFTLPNGMSGTYSVGVTLTQPGIFPTYRLDSTGTYRGINKRVSLTLRQISCARYAYLSDSEDQLFWWGSRPIWFVTGDVLNGPLHSNDQLNISHDPIFNGPVSSAASTINYYHGGPPNDNPDFRQSLTLGVPNIQLPSSADMITPLQNAAQQADGLYLTGNTVVTLLSDGTMNVTNQAKNWNDTNVAIPANKALFVNNGHVNISGILNGQLTVGTNNNIYIVGNLLYLHDPRTDPTSVDMLGLVSQNNVYVDSTAPYDLEIDAYMVALNTSFAVENYNTALKGTLTVLGGLTQERRGPIGTFSSVTEQKISGYTKDYNYDERLMSTAPLYFPPAKDSNGRIVYLKVLWAEY